MNSSQHKLFTPSGCLTPTAFTLLEEGKLSVEEQKKAMEHLNSCELCSLASEGLALVDLHKVDTDLAEVKRNLIIVRPLDFMHEQRDLRFRLRIRLLTILIIALLAAFVYFLVADSEKPNTPQTLPEELITPFKLERKDASTGRLQYKASSKKAQWDAKVRGQHKADTIKNI